MQGASLLKYKNYRYFKVTSLLMVIAFLAYVFIEPVGGKSYGGTWLGYALGIISTFIMLGLMWYGVAKRSITGTPDWSQIIDAREQGKLATQQKKDYRKHDPKKGASGGAALQEWLSGHIYLGASLLVLGTLHTGFHLGWNIHSLAYLLMMLVIASGFYGLNIYLNYPRRITQNMGDEILDDLLLKIVELDELASTRALNLPDEVNELVVRARLDTRLMGDFFEQWSGVQRKCPTHLAVHQLLSMGGKYDDDDQQKMMRDLYSVLLRKEKLVTKVRTDIMFKTRLSAWLYLHVPLGIALFAALTAHIVSILFYW
jgi:hypothetical protein